MTERSASRQKLGAMRQGRAGRELGRTRQRTRDRILDGAVRAVARHGLAKLGMSDVSKSAGVSRATLYRYFTTREELLDGLAAREGQRFLEHVLDALAQAPPGEERVRVVVEYATRHVREHPALKRLGESEPAFVLESLREQFPSIRRRLGSLLVELFEDAKPVRDGVITTDQLVDWMIRFLVSIYLFPDPNPEDTARGLTAMYRLMAAPAEDNGADRAADGGVQGGRPRRKRARTPTRGANA